MSLVEFRHLDYGRSSQQAGTFFSLPIVPQTSTTSVLETPLSPHQTARQWIHPHKQLNALPGRSGWQTEYNHCDKPYGDPAASGTGLTPARLTTAVGQYAPLPSAQFGFDPPSAHQSPDCSDPPGSAPATFPGSELPAQSLYDSFYVKRGADSEHRIKELKLGIQADRLSCHTFVANQFRLLLAQAAYILMLTIRHAARGTQFATAQVERLRSMLIKGAARVTVSVRRILVELAAYSPFAHELKQIVQRLLNSTALALG